MGNPPEHPFESAATPEPTSELQSAIDIHLEALAATFKAKGVEIVSICIGVRCVEPVDAAGNDSVNGYTMQDDAEPLKTILEHLARMRRAAMRTLAPELR